MTNVTTLKGPGQAQIHNGASLRIGIVHARWNTEIISALVEGARKSLLACGVQNENIVIQSVPGSYELPLAVQRMYTSSQIESSINPLTSATSTMTKFLPSASVTDITRSGSGVISNQTSLNTSNPPLATPFSAIIAIGVLIKGETMHFEYIADATSHGLMRVQLNLGIPIVFGLLTVFNEEQGKARAGMIKGSHCHGEDWGSAAVELGIKGQAWSEGRYV